MNISVEVNGRLIEAEKGETLLSALNRQGIHVPTICSMKGLSPSGACRMCVVEVEGRENLVPACSFPIEESLKILTHSPRVVKARKTNVELLLANHPDDCLYCERNGSCELQSLAEDLNIRERRIAGKKSPFKIDRSSPAIIRDPAKCILCGRCVRICEEIMATSAFDFAQRGNELRISTTLARPLNYSNCISCGQCLISCPTGALIEHMQFPELEAFIHSPDKKVVVQFTTPVAVAVGEMLGFKTGTDMSAVIQAALLNYGVNHVFETALGADILVEEQAFYFQEYREREKSMPLITSSCPAWVQYVEQYLPDLIPYLSPLKSPQQIAGGLAKSWMAKELSFSEENIVMVLVSSCTAAKSEARKVEMTRSGIPVVDLVLTTRELARLVRLSGLDLELLATDDMSDNDFKGSAGRLTGVAGGEAEATWRSIYNRLSGKEILPSRLHRFRIHKSYREMSVKAGNREMKMAAVSGMAKAIEVIEDIRSGKKELDLLEVMACPEGCVNGGGQPLPVNESITRSRTRAIFDLDNGAEVHSAHMNPVLKRLYGDFLGEPGSSSCRDYLYTVFSKREEFL